MILFTIAFFITLQLGKEKVSSNCSEKQVLTTDITALPCDHEETVLTEEGGRPELSRGLDDYH